MDWKPIRDTCTKAAEANGHKLGTFGTRKTASGTVRMVSCETCYGCCWIAWTITRGFITGGRLLKYKCGTPEAAGVK